MASIIPLFCNVDPTLAKDYQSHEYYDYACAIAKTSSYSSLKDHLDQDGITSILPYHNVTMISSIHKGECILFNTSKRLWYIYVRAVCGATLITPSEKFFGGCFKIVQTIYRKTKHHP